jgi:hypothetical protein
MEKNSSREFTIHNAQQQDILRLLKAGFLPYGMSHIKNDFKTQV